MSAADTLAASIGTEAPSESDTTDPILDEEVSQDEIEESPEETEEEVAEEETEEEPLPEKIKEILAKNRKAVREAEARALAAEKALAAKEKGAEETTESTPSDDKFKKLYIDNAAKAALVEAGLSTGTDRFLKMLDLSSVDVDDSGKISGLEDQIADLKADFKDILAPKKTVAKVDGSRRAAPAIPKSSAELLAARFA